jgi:hypothetical protein
MLLGILIAFVSSVLQYNSGLKHSNIISFHILLTLLTTLNCRSYCIVQLQEDSESISEAVTTYDLQFLITTLATDKGFQRTDEIKKQGSRHATPTPTENFSKDGSLTD